MSVPVAGLVLVALATERYIMFCTSASYQITALTARNYHKVSAVIPCITVLMFLASFIGTYIEYGSILTTLRFMEDFSLFATVPTGKVY